MKKRKHAGGAPRKGLGKRFSVSLEIQDEKDSKRIMALEKRSRVDFIREAVRYYLDFGPYAGD